MKVTNKVCFRGLDQAESWTLQAYRSIGGYQVWQKIMSEKQSPSMVLKEIKESNLMGRGGAGFLTGLKLSFMRRDEPGDKYLVCNSDEGEPGTCKDTHILRKNPHQLIEGMAIAAYVIGANVGYNYMRGEFRLHFERMESAFNEALAAGLMGDDILNSGFSFYLHNILGAGSYIVGEETAMLESLEGKRAMPRYKPPFPAQNGLYGCPTTVNNTETLASLPVILEVGGKQFAQWGKGNSGGYKVFCVSGHVKNPGVFELPMGTPFEEILDLAGGMRDAPLKAVIPGGSSMKVLTAHQALRIDMDFESLRDEGSAIGTGAIIIMDENTCMVEALENIMRFYAHESCGQCTPCREGAGWVYRTLCGILNGNGRADDVDRLYRIAETVEGKTICAFGEAFAWPVTSFIESFRDEFDYFVKHGHSKVQQSSRAFEWN